MLAQAALQKSSVINIQSLRNSKKKWTMLRITLKWVEFLMRMILQKKQLAQRIYIIKNK